MGESVELKYCLQLFGMFLLKFDIDVMFCKVKFYCFLLYKLYAKQISYFCMILFLSLTLRCCFDYLFRENELNSFKNYLKF